MVDGDGGDGAGRRPGHDIRRVAPAAQAHFKNAEIGLFRGEEHEGGGGDDLEDGDRPRRH